MKFKLRTRWVCVAAACLVLGSVAAAQAQVDTHADEIAQSNANVAASNARAAEANAEKAAIDAETARALAAAKSIPPSGVAGTTDTKTGSGATAEGTLLSARAVEVAAQQVVTQVLAALPTTGGSTTAETTPRAALTVEQLRTDPLQVLSMTGAREVVAGNGVLIVASTDTLDLATWQTFETRMTLLLHAFVDSHALFAQAEAADRTPGPARVNSITESNLWGAQSLTQIGGGLSLLSQLGSYFQSNYALGNIEITEDQGLLAAAVGDGLTSRTPRPSVYVLTSWTGMDNVEALTDWFRATEVVRVQALRELAIAKARIAALTTPNPTPAQVELKVKYETASTALTNALTAHDALAKSISEAPAAGQPPPMGVILQQMGTARALRQSRYVLMLNLNAQPSGYYTVQNLWTFIIPGPPVYVRGGAIVSYRLIERASNRLVRSDSIIVPGDYVTAGRVERYLNPPPPRSEHRGH